MSSLVFLSKIRALMWVRSLYDELKVDERIWWVCLVRSWSDVKKSGLSGEVGCAGVLRNSEGVARAVFSGPCAAKDSNATEVGPISLALHVFLEMGWKGRVVPRRCLAGLSSIGNVSFSRVDKHSNARAFALAVAGLKRQVFFVLWSVYWRGFFCLVVGGLIAVL
ncbi:hypothetical protein J1N35_028559 [Gossypium stocksii]|uniref:RNase H type-1 domain-containing protein n=1 Tax=Gossypium stocksii TaxID=47602 RepID=A0A9D3UW81_9ROSI|nr:hypothetical protein J1N35_028559 [Gossypium stocksii]